MPKRFTRHIRPFSHAFEFGVGDGRVDGTETGEGAKTAVGAGHDAVAAEISPVLMKSSMLEDRQGYSLFGGGCNVLSADCRCTFFFAVAVKPQ
jgi:hypothetical protein